jgi:hypothetical protein
MKIGLSEAAARKVLVALTTADPKDEDVNQVRERLETGLKATTAAGHLVASELEALVIVVMNELNNPKHVLGGTVAAVNTRGNLRTALPKLQNLLARKESGW